MRYIDPPSGWRYGFPKPFPETTIPTVEWLVANGYPQREIDACGDQFYVRIFYDGSELERNLDRPGDATAEGNSD